MAEVIIKEIEEVKEKLSEEEKEVKIRVVVAFLVFISLVLVGGWIYSKIEYYPGTLERWSYLDGIYFATMTVTTVGYGDFIPATGAGKIFTMIYSFIGIAVAAYVFFVVGRYLMHYNIVLLKKGRRRLIRRPKQPKKK